MEYLSKSNIADIYPLSPLQQGMLFHSLYEPGTGAYAESFSCIIEGALDVEAFTRAWNHLVDAYAVFRTVFNWKDAAQPVQIVLKRRPVECGVRDLWGMSEPEQQQARESLILAERRIPFDLARGPLMRLTLLRLDEARWFFNWSYHHLILDGWCLGLIMQDFARTYAACRAGQAPPSIDRPPYRAYLAWLKTRDEQPDLDFWRSYLAGFTAPTPLPRDRGGEGLEIADAHARLTPQQTSTLTEFARRERLTLSSVVQGLWGLLLSRLSGEDDVTFGLTVSGRPPDLKGSTETVGLFINTIPVRARIDEDRPVWDWLHAFARSSAPAFDHAQAFLPRIKAVSDVDSSRPLFDSIVVFENYPLDRLDAGGGMRFSEVEVRETTNLDLCLVAMPGRDLALRLSYNRRRFSPELVAELLAAFVHLCVTLPAENVPLRTLGLLDADRQRRLTGFNPAAVPLAAATVHELFERCADRDPERTAVIDGEVTVSYGELDRRADRVARMLEGQGLVPGDVVGVCLERSALLVGTLLGILKAGCCYLPLDPEYPPERLAFMLADSGAAHVFADEGVFLADDVRVLEPAAQCSPGDAPRPSSGVVAGDLAYLVYTSGSTGAPKGIEIEHGGVVNYLTWAADFYGLRGSGGMPLFTSLSFDLTVTALFAPLVCGEAVTVIDPELDPVAAVAAVLQSGCGVAKLTPAHLEMAVRLAADGVEKDPGLRTLIVGGEALGPALCREAFTLWPGVTVCNEYGPAETVVGCIVHAFERLAEDAPAVPIGRPIANTRIGIRDKRLRPLPPGVLGEICIAGAGVGRGYRNRPEQSAERFVSEPGQPDRRCYRSGDRGRISFDGTVEYLGRLDDQVKIRGYRIEPGEIAAVLEAQAGVRESVVCLKNVGGREVLVGWCSGENLDEPTLREALRRSLPSWMVPARLVFVDELPLTPNGKVDRERLPAPEPARTSPREVAAYTEAEEALAAVWGEVLEKDDPGPGDNFFELGGDSILSLQVVSRYRARGWDLTPREIFEIQTFARLAAAAREHRQDAAVREPATGRAPLTPIQRWLFGQKLVREHHYNLSVHLSTAGVLEAPALRTALQAVYDHHDALRLRCDGADQEFSPPAGEVRLNVLEVSDEAALAGAITALQESFDPGRGAMFAAGLYTLGDREHLVLCAHHLVMDTVSWRIILEDLLQAYGRVTGGQPPVLPEKTVSCREWACWLTGHVRRPEVQAEADWWRRELGGVSPTLVIDRDEGENDVGAAALVRTVLDEQRTAELLTGAHATYHTEVPELLLTALMRAFAHRQEGLSVAVERHGREDMGLDLSRTVGWFTTIHPLILRPDGTPELSAQVRYVKEKLRSIPERGFNYGLLKHCGGHDDLPDLPELSFNYVGRAAMDHFGDVLTLHDHVPALIAPENRRACLIDVVALVFEGRLHTAFIYSSRHFAAEAMERLAGRFSEELENVLHHCLDPANFDLTPADFDLVELSADELEELYV